MMRDESFSAEEMEVLREIFLASSTEYLAVARRLLADWPAGDPGEARLKDLHRAMHSIKGAALQIGFDPIGTLAKSQERLVLAVLAGTRLDETWLRLMRRGCDALEQALAELRAQRAELPPADDRLLRELDGWGASPAATAGLQGRPAEA